MTSSSAERNTAVVNRYTSGYSASITSRTLVPTPDPVPVNNGKGGGGGYGILVPTTKFDISVPTPDPVSGLCDLGTISCQTGQWKAEILVPTPGSLNLLVSLFSSENGERR